MQYPWAGKTAAVPLTCRMVIEPEHTHTHTLICTGLSVKRKQKTIWWCAVRVLRPQSSNDTPQKTHLSRLP